ncbi:hypothetical protein RRG54_02515 [Mycoplasmopsis felis]|uniref:hypothetical protein n=1 Tax=Mycoplasmopsis felis TaxID=33923 RepID=UPI00300CB485
MDIYQEKENEIRLKNKKDILLNLSEYEEKIKKYAKRFNYDFDYLVQMINENEFLLNSIIKEPSKQNFHELVVKDYVLEYIPEFINFIKLPTDSNESLYLSSGNIIKKKDLTTNNHTKSIDFYWEMNVKGKNVKFYASHKYTKESGGAQDNQFKDLQNFLEHAKQYTKKDSIFVGICDGDYYHKNNQKKLIALKIGVINTNCIVTSLKSLWNDVLEFVQDNYSE